MWTKTIHNFFKTLTKMIMELIALRLRISQLHMLRFLGLNILINKKMNMKNILNYIEAITNNMSLLCPKRIS